MVNDDKRSPKKVLMKFADDYYGAKNTSILNKFRYFYDASNNIIQDHLAANNQMPSSFLKTLIDQAVSFSLTNKPSITTDESQQDMMMCNKKYILKRKLDKIIKTAYKNARKKGVCWLYYFVNDKGEFDYVLFDAREIIPIYDHGFQRELIQIIRYFEIKVVDNKGSEVTRHKVEVYDKDGITTYMEDTQTAGFYNFASPYIVDDSTGNSYGDPTVLRNPLPYVSVINTNNPSETTDYGWGKVPFIKLAINEEETPDLQAVKQFIDAYDKTVSVIHDEMEEHVDHYYEVRGYDMRYDEKSGQDRGRNFIQNLRGRKFVPVQGDGGVTVVQKPFDVGSKLEVLKADREMIFLSGQGVDMLKENNGNIAGVALEKQYDLLESKASEGEEAIAEFVRALFSAVNDYIELVKPNADLAIRDKLKDCGVIDPDLIEVSFNRKVVTDELAASQAVKNYTGITSKKTQLKMVPGVEDVSEEEEQILKESREQRDVFDVEGEGDE